jgi:hypothetical protein
MGTYCLFALWIPVGDVLFVLCRDQKEGWIHVALQHIKNHAKLS